MKIVYVAGPYFASTYDGIGHNIARAEQEAIWLWNNGYAAFCPHLNTAHFEVKAHAPESAYRGFDLRMLASCDALLVCEGWENSSGTKAEIAEAQRLGIPVYYSREELLDGVNSLDAAKPTSVPLR